MLKNDLDSAFHASLLVAGLAFYNGKEQGDKKDSIEENKTELPIK